MKKLAALAAASVLWIGLAGCNTSSPEEAFVSEMSEALEPPTGAPPTEQATAELNTPIAVTCYSHLPCDGEVKVTELSVGGECRYGFDDYGDPNYGVLEEEQTVLQAWGEFSLATAANGWTMLDDPQVVDEEGFTQNASWSSYCEDAPTDYEDWSQTVDTGQKIRVYGSWVIPEGASEMLLHDTRIELPKAEEPNSSTSSPATSASAAPVAEPTVVECLFGTPGPSLMSDGTTIYTDYCFSALGGPAYLEQESQSGLQDDPSNIPFADGGTCPAYRCGYGTNDQGQPNPSSGEIQTLHGCQEGYITDPDLCGAVAWVENHQY